VTDTFDLASLIEEAQKAADAGDYPTAERLLREAATIQEATLGPLHPDLASTLNNLAFVCERTNNIAEAERGYRRAHAIAVASLGPRDPFVATSIKNLVGFCATHGIPIWKPPSVQPETEVVPPDTESAPESPADSPQEPVPVVAWQRPVAIAVAALAIIVVAVVFTTRRAPQTPTPISAPAPSPTTPAPTRGVEPAVVTAPRPQPAPPPVERKESLARIATTGPVTVLNAQLCKALARRGTPDWQCTSAGADLQPGTLFFYTRLLTAANTTVEHRWYRGERVHQVMKLRVAPTPGSGYRTFSSNTVSAERAGDWKVELRTADGTVLQEQRFVIRLP
jgi:DUF2914 family protein/tetratricopeptide repeat protein